MFKHIKQAFVLIIIAITMSAIVSIPVLAELDYNAQIDKFYSKNATSDVDQNEYNLLVVELRNSFYPLGFMYLTNYQKAIIFAQLKIRGTPAALRLIHDCEIFIKEVNENVRKLNNG